MRIMRRKLSKELMKLFENDRHWLESESVVPELLDDVVEGNGGGFEEFGKDGVVIVEDGAGFLVLLFGFQ